MVDMDQITLGLDPLSKRTGKDVFLDEMNQVVPSAELVALIQPHARGAHQAQAPEGVRSSCHKEEQVH